MEINLQDLATKQDLGHLEERIDAKFTHFEQRLVMMEQRLTIKVGIMLSALIGILKALDKLLG